MAAFVALPAAFYLLLKPRQDDAGSMVEIADLARLAEGKPLEVVYTRTRVDGWKQVKEKTTAWVVKAGRTDAIAYSPQCTHLGCAYHWEEAGRKFVCPCHNSEFSLDGKVLTGPAPRPLDRLPSKIVEGKLLIGQELETS
jgi:menaquinol-cytochrome c reductase iron-sulfur subunit